MRVLFNINRGMLIKLISVERDVFDGGLTPSELFIEALKPFADFARWIFAGITILFDIIWFYMKTMVEFTSDLANWLANLITPIVMIILDILSIGIPVFFVLAFLSAMLSCIFSDCETESSKTKKKTKNLLEYFSCLRCEYLEIIEQSYFVPNHGTRIENKAYCRLLDDYIPKLKPCKEFTPYIPKLED